MEKKQLPRLNSDAGAKAFAAEADLTEFDLSTLVPVRFELKGRDTRAAATTPQALTGWKASS